MTKEHVQGSVKLMARTIDRRRFLDLSRKYAIVAPPAVGLLIAATDAKAHCQLGGEPGHNTADIPSCTPNHG